MGLLAEEAEARIKLQRQLIAELRAESRLTDLARELLALLEAMRVVYKEDYEKLGSHTVSGPSPMWR